MQANPLLGGNQKQEEGPPPANEDQRVISLISNFPADQIDGLDHFHSFFNSPEVKAEVNPFRYVIQRRARRSMGGKFSSGLSQEVTESVEINPNEDIFGLRRWVGGVKQDPASVLLVQVNKIKESPLAAPMIFSDLMKTGRPVLVTGPDRTVQDQLFAKIIPDCSQIPTRIQQNSSLKTMLLARVTRRKGFVGTMRYLLDLDFLPQQIQEKISKINGGGDPSELSDAEVINLSLLSDLSSRYLNALSGYKETLESGSLNIQQMMGMFEILMADVPLESALKAFSEFFGKEDERPEEVNSKSDLYGYLNRYINSTEGSSRKMSRSEKVDEVCRRINSVVIQQRVKTDPILWKRCHFIYKPEPEEQELLSQLEPLYQFLGNYLKDAGESLSDDFKEKMGGAIYDLVTKANIGLEEAEKGGGLVRQRVAQHYLPMFQMSKFQASHLIQVAENNRETILNRDKFISLFKNTPVTVEDIKLVWSRLDSEFNRDKKITDAIRETTLDVIVGHAKDREKSLRDIYIINAAQELVNFSFHFGDKNISGIDRLCGIAVMGQRFGFEISTKQLYKDSIGLFTDEKEAPLGKLQNEAAVISRSYTALIGSQVERQVKKMVDHKIGYLTQTFGDNFFEVIYQKVITRHDLPLSRNQLAWFVKERGLLGSLMEKGFKSKRENDMVDSFMTLDKPTLSGKAPERDFREFDSFEKDFKEANLNFKKLLGVLKVNAEQDPTSNIHSLIWSLYKRGIYNLERSEAKDTFRKSEFYNKWKDLIAKISSENYSIFTKDIQEEGVKIYVMPKFHHLLTIGTRFGYLIESKIVRYQVIASPAETLEELDPVSKVFNEKIQSVGQNPGSHPEFKLLFEGADEVARITEVWRNHSRHLCFALLDRFLTETVIKQLIPGKVTPNNLWYLPDAVKLGLGPSLVGQQTVPFQKILQVPENMGNIQKNPKSCSTTIDDFTIEVHKIHRLRDELANLESVGEDVLDIIQNLTHERAESQLVLKYEQALTQMNRILSIPLRHFSEKEVEALHKVTLLMKATLAAFYTTPGTLKDQLVMRVQNQLQTRRSDGHLLKLNFSDVFILEKTEIRVTQRTKQGTETVSRQRKVEVEVESSYQTLATRVREVIRTHEILAHKRHVVFSPEGQKKKQVHYVKDIIEVLQLLRGNALKFYVDSTTMTDGQMHELATRIKPHHFFRMDDLKPEPPEGMKVDGVKDPLTGRMVRKPPQGQPAPPAIPQAG